MNRKKMNGLFRTEETTDLKTGKIRRIVHYIGPYYRVRQDALQKARSWLTAMAIGGVLLYAVTGLLATAAARSAFVTVVYLLTALTLYHGFCGWLEMRKMTTRVDELEKEETIQKTHDMMLLQMILNGLWLVGDAVFLMTDILPHDAVKESLYLLCVLAMTALSFRTWQVLGELKPERIEEETAATPHEKQKTEGDQP